MKQPDLTDIGNKCDVASHRIHVAQEDLRSAHVLLEADSYRAADRNCRTINPYGFRVFERCCQDIVLRRWRNVDFTAFLLFVF